MMPAVFLCAAKMQNVASLLKRIAIVVVALLIIWYIGDFISLKIRRVPLSTVQISTLYAVAQKDGKTEYEAGDPETQTCVNSMFPHMGYNPCWYVKRHKTKQVNL
jgi:hypothetical protein